MDRGRRTGTPIGSSVRSVACLALALVAGERRALAHEDYAVRIIELDATLSEQPDNAHTLLERARVRLLRQEWTLAEGDLDAARALRPGLDGLVLLEAELAFAGGRHREALAAARRCLELDAGNLRAHDLMVELARSAERLAPVPALVRRDARGRDRFLEAAAARRAARGAPRVADVLQVSEHLAWRSGAQLEQALREVQQGIAALGAVPALVDRAIELELRAGRPQAALAHLDARIAGARRPAYAMADRADLLEALGRPLEAAEQRRAALDSARTAIGARRPTRALLALEQRLAQALAHGPKSANEAPPRSR